MKYFFISLVYHSLFLLLRVQGFQNSIDAHLGKRYQFELFEDSRGCAEVYNLEAKVVNQLFIIKAYLLKVQDRMNELKLSKNSNIDDMEELIMISEQGKNFQKLKMQDFKQTIQKFPQIEDFIGSIKAMFILHYSYGIDMSRAVLEGVLAYTNHHGKLRKHQVKPLPPL